MKTKSLLIAASFVVVGGLNGKCLPSAHAAGTQTKVGAVTIYEQEYVCRAFDDPFDQMTNLNLKPAAVEKLCKAPYQWGPYVIQECPRYSPPAAGDEQLTDEAACQSKYN